jgi:hypothetical protein
MSNPYPLTQSEYEELLLLRRLWKSDALDYKGEQRYIELNDKYNKKNSVDFISGDTYEDS